MQSGANSITADGSGGIFVEGLSSGVITLSVSKDGYYSTTAQYTVTAGDNSQRTIYLTARPAQSTTQPVAAEISSPQGIISSRECQGHWDWRPQWPGTVPRERCRFSVGGVWYDAVTQDVGGGLASATVSIPIPTSLLGTTEVQISATNSDGQTTVSGDRGVFLRHTSSFKHDFGCFAIMELTEKRIRPTLRFLCPFGRWRFRPGS